MKNISKIVVTENEGKKIGWVLDVAVDFSALQKIGYYVVDDESGEEYLLRQEKILAVSEKYILVSSVLDLEFSAVKQESLLGKEVLSQQGDSLGVIRSIIFKKDKIDKISTEKCEILPKFITKIGNDIVFVDFKRKGNKPPERAFPHTDLDIPVSVQSQGVILPEKVSLATKYYIGKTCMEDILGYNNEKIIFKNEIITKNVVEKAKKHNKLNQLFFAIKR